MFAMELPNSSPADSVGPFSVESLISTVESTEPSVFINMICTAPRLLPVPSSSCIAPTAKSLTPSPSRSPIFSAEYPNRSSFVNVGPFVVSELISTVDFTEPSLSMNNICTVPRLLPAALSSFDAPTTKSITPSPSKSPMFAIE